MKHPGEGNISYANVSGRDVAPYVELPLSDDSLEYSFSSHPTVKVRWDISYWKTWASLIVYWSETFVGIALLTHEELP